MFRRIRWFNVVFVLALLLGMLPVVGGVPRATAVEAAPAALDLKDSVLSASEARSSQSPVVSAALAPAVPQATHSTAFPPPSGLSVDERLHLNSIELFDTGVAAFDNVNGYGYFVVSGRVIVKVHLSDGERVSAIGFWPDDGDAIVAFADPQRDMLYFGTDSTPAKIVRVRISTFKRIDALTLPAGISLTGAAVMPSDGNSAYLATGTLYGGSFTERGLIQVRFPDFVILRGTTGWGPGVSESLTLDEANGRIYVTNGDTSYYNRIGKLELADMSWDEQRLSDGYGKPLIDVTRGLIYNGDLEYGQYFNQGVIRRFQLSDMTEVTPTLELSDAVTQYTPHGIAISPDHNYAYFLAENNEVPKVGTLIRIQLSDFTYEDNYSIDGPYLSESLVMNPNSGAVYMGFEEQPTQGSPNTIGGYWQTDGGRWPIMTTLWAHQEHASDLMLDAANGYAYTYGQLRQHIDPDTFINTYYYGLTKIRLSDFTRDETIDVTSAGNQQGLYVIDYLGGGIDLLGGDIHLATWDRYASSGDYYELYRVDLSNDDVGRIGYPHRLNVWDRPDEQYMMYDFPRGVAYLDPNITHNGASSYQEGMLRAVIEDPITVTQFIDIPVGDLLAVDDVHDHVYTYNSEGLHKLNGTALSIEATLPLTSRLGSYPTAFALDPANDAAYAVSSSGYVLFKLRLSDLSVVMSRTIPSAYALHQPAAATEAYNWGKHSVLDPDSGYGYYYNGNDGNLVQFRLDDLAIMDSLDLNGFFRSMDLDPEEGIIYIAADTEVLKIGLSGGKSVTPASDVPYHGVVAYTLNLAGHLTLTDTNVVLTDTLPAEVDFVDWVEQPTGATVTDDVIRWSGQLNPREVVTLTFTAQHNGDYNETVLNTAEYSGTVVHRNMRATFTVESPPPLPIVKTVTPAQADPGDVVTYTLRFTNTTGVAATNVVITDVLPPSLENVQVSSSLSITARGGTQYVWDVDNDLEPFASGIVTITGQLAPDTPTGPVNNTATLLGITDGVTHTHSSSAVLDVSGAPPVPPALAISKTAEEYGNTPPLLVGDRILYTIRVTNTTTGTVTGLVVTDTLPAGVSYFGIPKGSPRPDQTGNPVVWNLSSLVAGATQTFKVIVKATGAVSPLGDNVATATCTEDTAPVSASANLDDAAVQQALELLKDAVDVNGAPLLVDDVIRYTIVVTNAHASVTMTGVVVTDTLPSGTVFVTSTQPYTEAAGTLWWQVGDIAPGASWTVAVDQRVDGSVNPIAGNVAAVRSDQQDWQETGDVYPPDPVIPTALKLGKTAEEYRNAPPLLENDRILYTIVVTNTSASAVSDVVITDTLPAGVSYFGIPKGAPRPDQTGNPVVWSLSSLAAGATQTFRVIVKVDGTANPIGENHATATCAEEDLPAGATAQVPGDGVHEPGLVVSGMVSGGGTLRQRREPATALEVGDLFTYTLTATNSNTALTLHNLVVTATLPSGAELVSATPAGSVSILLPYLRWHQATLEPGATWQAEVVLRQTGATLGSLELVAASDEQSPVAITITSPGGYWVYLPLVLR